MTDTDRSAVRLYAVGGWSIRRTAAELGLTVGQVTGYADRHGVRFHGAHYGRRSVAMCNRGYDAERRKNNSCTDPCSMA